MKERLHLFYFLSLIDFPHVLQYVIMALFEYLSLNHSILCQCYIFDINIVEKPWNRRWEIELVAFLRVSHPYFKILYWKCFFWTTKTTVPQFYYMAENLKMDNTVNKALNLDLSL